MQSLERLVTQLPLDNGKSGYVIIFQHSWRLEAAKRLKDHSEEVVIQLKVTDYQEENAKAVTKYIEI